MNVYLYVLDTLADWEIAYLTAEINSKRYFKNKKDDCKIVKVGASKDPIITMGGMSIKPDIQIGEMKFQNNDILVLPGGDTWLEEKNKEILLYAKELIKNDQKVAAICGATIGLAKIGVLDKKKHTSNAKDLLKIIGVQNNHNNSN